MHHCQSRRNRTASPPLMKTHHRSLYSRSRQRRATRFHSLLKPNSFLGLFTSYFAREPLHGFVRAGLSDFVPEGLNDSSQAIYCLVSVRKRNRPVGNGMIGSDRRATIRTINQSGARDQTVPCRTDSRWNRFQAINCPATIIQSLRDGLKNQALRLVSDRPLSMMQPQKKICVICEICGSFRLICVRAYLPIGGRPYSLTLLSRNALATTDTELNDIAAPAMIGLRSSPKNG
jgi:hypothetical protein